MKTVAQIKGAGFAVNRSGTAVDCTEVSSSDQFYCIHPGVLDNVARAYEHLPRARASRAGDGLFFVIVAGHYEDDAKFPLLILTELDADRLMNLAGCCVTSLDDVEETRARAGKHEVEFNELVRELSGRALDSGRLVPPASESQAAVALDGAAKSLLASADEVLSLEFSEKEAELLSPHARALLLNVLFRHQGGNSKIGRPIRALLGIGRFDNLTEDQVSVARWVGGALEKAETTCQPREGKAMPLVAEGCDATVWQLGVFNSSSSPGQQVRTLIEGAENIAYAEKRSDFVAWLCSGVGNSLTPS